MAPKRQKKANADRKDVPVSVVIPCYDCAVTIDRALASVWKQTWLPREVILVNDGQAELESTLRSLASNYPQGWLRVICLPENIGAGAARNIAWEEAEGDFIAFLDADDSWHPRKIEHQLGYMLAHPDVVLSGHDHLVVNGEETVPEGREGEFVARQVRWRSLLFKNRFVTPSVMVRRTLEYRFDTERRYMEDHLLWLQIACDGLTVFRLATPLVYIHKPQFGASGLSGQLLLMEKGELANFIDLRRQKRISWFYLLLLFPYSLIKFGRRCLMVALR